ncbi:unnamed protein product [Meganyctiphanes norvegica]|uniref:UDP-N-acetylmuramyl-tripeptide synthetase n=1 Tax=Meganyctiphanes norvegica TaxID=48144 RepID=A0AAV2RRV5_MEGNR
MLLSKLVENIIDTSIPDFIVKGITNDSRRVKPGYIFVLLNDKNKKYINDAHHNGAKAIISSLKENIKNNIFISSPYDIYHKLASKYYAKQPKNIVGVTGTNGKTSVSNICRDLVESAGLPCARIGTLGLYPSIFKYNAFNTTPNASDLHRTLDILSNINIEHVAMEVSRHGVDSKRAHSVRFTVAAFTHLIPDHPDAYGTMDSHFRSKKKLFTDLLTSDGVLVLNADVPEYEKLCNAAKGRLVISYGRKAEDIILVSQKLNKKGQEIEYIVNGVLHTTLLPLYGVYQAHNALCAIAIMKAFGINNFKMGAIKQVPGRMQTIDNHLGIHIFVDYGVSPETLEQNLKSIRYHFCGIKNPGLETSLKNSEVKSRYSFSGKIILVLSQKGKVYTGKIPSMGKIANDLADHVIVCDGDPRTEDPAIMRKQILASVPHGIEIGNRKEAILYGVNLANPGDVVLIAGKGHEYSQFYGGRALNISDAEALKEILKSKLSSL